MIMLDISLTFFNTINICLQYGYKADMVVPPDDFSHSAHKKCCAPRPSAPELDNLDTPDSGCPTAVVLDKL